MDELVRWLGEQLDVDERIVRAAPPGPWTMDGSGSIVAADGQRVVCSVGGAIDGRVSRWPEGPVVEHVLAHDPARVLREIDWKRQLVGRYERAMGNRRAHPDDLASAGALLALHGAVKLLALPYADRPGFQESWRP